MLNKKKDSQLELLKDIAAAIVPASGDKVVDVLYKKKNVNEYIIAQKLNLTINQTRNVLYKLSDHGIVRFIRKKDKKKGGWYTYFWTLNIERSLSLLKEQLKKRVEKIDAEIKNRSQGRFYFSPSAQLEYSEEEALENNFICPETGEVLEIKDDSKMLSQMEIEKNKINLILERLNSEIETVSKKTQMIKDRRVKEEQKQKEEIRRVKREKARREKEKSKKEKKHLKKNPKQKSVKKKRK